MQAQIEQASNDVGYYDTEFQRQEGLLGAHVASEATFDSARRNLQNAQQKLASLGQQLAAIAANLDGDPIGPVEKIHATSALWRSAMRPHDNSRIRSLRHPSRGLSATCRPLHQANICKLL